MLNILHETACFSLSCGVTQWGKYWIRWQKNMRFAANWLKHINVVN